MNPHPLTRHRRPRWFVSGAFWALLVLADLAVLSLWATLCMMVLAAGCAGALTLRRRRRLLAAGGAPVVTGPSGAPLEAAPTGIAPPVASPAPAAQPAPATEPVERPVSPA